MFAWVKEFEDQFDISNNNENTIKIIIGQSPYKQKLNKIQFKVSSTKAPFKYFRYIAFLVTDWIKVQDSLEMIFNLLFASSFKGLEAISYLRSHRISAEDFGLYLYRQHRILLVNRFLDSKMINSKFTGFYDRAQYIRNFTKRNSNLGIQILYVGKEAGKDLRLQNVESAVAVHPSGSNLNKDDVHGKYYKVWYEFNKEALENSTANFNLSCFHIVK